MPMKIAKSMLPPATPLLRTIKAGTLAKKCLGNTAVHTNEICNDEHFISCAINCKRVLTSPKTSHINHTFYVSSLLFSWNNTSFTGVTSLVVIVSPTGSLQCLIFLIHSKPLTILKTWLFIIKEWFLFYVSTGIFLFELLCIEIIFLVCALY